MNEMFRFIEQWRHRAGKKFPWVRQTRVSTDMARECWIKWDYRFRLEILNHPKYQKWWRR